MKLIDADALVEAILEARISETNSVPKMIRFVKAQPTIEPKKIVEPKTIKDIAQATAEISVADEESLLIKTDWKIYGRFNRVVVTDGESHWKFYYKGKNEPKPLTIEPKRGRWIENGIEIKCSECGEGWEASEGWKKDDIKKFFRYCSSCGARMEAEE